MQQHGGHLSPEGVAKGLQIHQTHSPLISGKAGHMPGGAVTEGPSVCLIEQPTRDDVPLVELRADTLPNFQFT